MPRRNGKRDAFAKAREVKRRKTAERRKVQQAVEDLARRLDMEPGEAVCFAQEVCEKHPDVGEYMRNVERSRQLKDKLGLEG